MARTSKGFLVVAAKLQEAATSLSHDDIRKQLNDALNGLYQGTGTYCYLVDVFGDDQSGNIIYSCNGDLMQAPYEIANPAGKRSCEIQTDQAIEVLPRTVYEPEADEGDHMSAMEAARLLVAGCELEERFISKGERDTAGSASFAGKGKSFPILKSGDVMAAVRSIGRAGAGNYSADTIKSNIKRIAKAKGWSKYLPDSWTSGDAKESVTPTLAGSMKLVESATFSDVIRLGEADAKTDYAVKLIAPGKGSSAFYPAEVLKRDGPKVFKAGMHMYWNHQTAAEEAARPEGDMSHLAGVLTSNAYYDEAGKKGPGLYAKAKVFSDYAKQVEEKAPHTGVSIRAMGEAESGVMKEGRPVLSKFVAGESVDFVTHAGAGGIVLTESAQAAEENSMNEVQLKEFNDTKAALKVAEAENQKNTAALLKVNQRLALGEAARCADRYFGTLQGIAPGIVARVTERVLKGTVPLTEAGDLDAVKFEAVLVQETKDETAYISSLTGGARIQGLGAVAPIAQTPEQLAEADKAHEKNFKESMARLGSTFVGEGDEHKIGRETFIEGRAA